MGRVTSLKNRWVQLGASLVAMIMIANLQYAWTLFVEPLRHSTGWKLSEIQWAFTLFVLCETWAMPIEGWLIDRAGPRLFTTAASLLCGFGWSALSIADQKWQLYLFYAIAGVGAAFVYSGSIACALKWFPDKRGLAAGIIAGGFGSGSALFIPLIHNLIEHQGYRRAFLVTGIAQGIVILLAAQVLRFPDESFTKRQWPVKHNAVHARRNIEQFTTWEMLRTPHFYLLYSIMVMMAVGGLLITAQAGPVAKEWHIQLTALTTALALDRVSNGFSRVFWGWLSDRLGREITMFVAFGLNSLALLSVLHFGPRSGAWFTFTLVITFFTWGEVFSLFPSIVGDYFGGRNAASNYSFMYSGKGVASIVGGGLAALLFEKFGTWSIVLYGSAALAGISALLALGLRALPLPAKAALPVLSAPVGTSRV